LGTNPGGILGAAGLLVDPSLPNRQVAKSCIITMVVMCPPMDGLSVKQWHWLDVSISGHWRAVKMQKIANTKLWFSWP